ATLTRTGLSREVAGWLGWRDGRGRLRDMSCRVALLKLARCGAIELPPARAVSFAPVGDGPVLEQVAIEATLRTLGPVELVRVTARAQSRIWRALMAQHPLGAGPLCGAQLRYLIRSRAGYLGALSFSAPARRLAAREAFIGWDEATRQAKLQRVVNNSRFLILPSVKVPHLASHVLGLAARRLARDWQAVYGVAPVLLETFVDQDHRGTCYRAANWTEIGHTTGRGRQDRQHAATAGPKRIFVRPLVRHWRRALVGSSAPAAAPAPADWAEREFGSTGLPDARLKRRLLTLARDFYARPCANVPQACGSRAKTKAAYRFFDHPGMQMQTLLAGHYQATAARLEPEPVVLAVQDTTSLNYTAHPATTGLGPISHVRDAQGLELHCTLAFTPTGVPLGLLHVQCWARDPEDFGKKVRRHRTPIEAKESAKWLKSYQATAKVAAHSPARIVSVGDREADLYALFELAARTEHGPGLLVRASHNRALAQEQQRLWPTLEARPAAGQIELQVPRQGSRAARCAQLDIRFAEVHLEAPARHRQDQPPLQTWAVLASEREAPAGVTPLTWMLLTTVPVTTVEHAVEKLKWYAQRWNIEVFHRTLKSGCRIEDRQLGNADRLEACLAIDLVVAWRIQRLTQLGRAVPQAPCSVYFDGPQWRALMIFTSTPARAPSEPPTLHEAMHRVAALGGFLGRKSDGEPGTQTLWRGLQRLDDITGMYIQMTDATHPRVSSRYDSG
ncbi:MAG: IS4 family transposase, partial [Nitrococcus sp.]|nr:IS4 family transposase [Nitrococcus sp.]